MGVTKKGLKIIPEKREEYRLNQRKIYGVNRINFTLQNCCWKTEFCRVTWLYIMNRVLCLRISHHQSSYF